MVSKTKSESNRREKVADYFFGLSKLSFTGAGLGGLSPLFKGGEFTIDNGYQVIFGILMTYAFYWYANRILKQK